MVELDYKTHITIVVSAGHTEYMPEMVGSMTYEWIWPPGLDPEEFELYTVSEEALEVLWERTNPRIPQRDWDLSWESICSIRGTEEEFQKSLAKFIVDAVASEPHGDDDVFDYWPSAVRMALEMAEQLKMEWATADATTAARDVILNWIGDWETDLLHKCGVWQEGDPE